MSRPTAALLALLIGSTALPTRAANPTEKAAAQALFDEAKVLMDKGQTSAACAKFQESIDINPAPGAILNLAVCDETLGKTATAWLLFNQSVSLARKPPIRKDREELAKEHLAKLDPILSKITVSVASDAQSLSGLDVSLDGATLGAATWGNEVPVDPGPHHIKASAPGHLAYEVDLTIGAKKDRQSVTIPSLPVDPESAQPAKPDDTTAAVVVPVTPNLPSNAATPDLSVPRSNNGSAQRTWGIVVGSVGLASLGFAIAEGLHAHHEKLAMDSAQGVNESAYSDHQGNAKSAVTLGRIGLGVGLLGLGAGAWLYFTAPHASSVAEVRVLPAVGGAVILGSF